MDIKNFYELRASQDGRTISGCAIKFNSQSVVLGNTYEQIARSAVDQELIDKSDILFTYNHDRSKVLARSRRGEGSLHTELRDDGLYFSFEAPNTQLGDDTLEEIRRGDLVNCSFAFRTKRDKEHYVMTRNADGSSLRTILKIDSLHDLSCVYEPAYEKTYLEARSAEAAEDEEMLKESESEQEEEKKSDEEEVKAPDVEEQKPDESEEEQKSDDEKSEDDEKRSDEDEKPEDEKPNDEKSDEDEEQKSDDEKSEDDAQEEVSDDEEQKSEDEEEKEDKKDAENERSNVKNISNIKVMKNFSLIQTVNDLIEHRSLNEAARQINEFGVRSMKEAGITDIGQFVLPYDTRSAVTVAAEGEDVVPTQIMDVLGPLRAKNVMVQAGAKFMSGLTGDVQIPSYSASNCAWKGETTAAEDGAGSFGHKTFSPKKLTTYIQVSRQFLIQATPDAEEILRTDLINSINDKLEETLLSGDAGSATKPAGIFNGATFADCSNYAGIAALEAGIEEAGVFEGKYILSPGAKAALRTTQKGNGVGFIWENGAIDGVDALSTAHVKKVDAAGGAAAYDKLVYGDWTNFAICSWGPGLNITVDPYTGAKNDVVNIIVTGYFDGGVLRDNVFGFGKIEKA